MKTLIIQGTPYQFPEPSESPQWGKEVTDWATAVTEALQGVAGTFDIENLSFSLDNSVGLKNITNLSFDPIAVQALQIHYGAKRTKGSTNLLETGNLLVIYDTNAAVSSKWTVVRNQAGSANIDFYITDAGQVQVNELSAIATTGTFTGSLRIDARAFEL